MGFLTFYDRARTRDELNRQGLEISAALRTALQSCRRHFVGAGVFSALVNLLYIAPTIYMLQVYDRVVPTQGLQTLLFLTLVLALALLTLALLDRVRSRLLVRAGVQIDAVLAPVLLDATIRQPGLSNARQALRDFDTLRTALSGQVIIAVLDAPWTPLYVLVAFLVHPWLGLVAVLACMLMPLLAWLQARATQGRLQFASLAATASYATTQDVLDSSESVRALGMRRAMVARQLRTRAMMLSTQLEASLSISSYATATKFARLLIQSLALGVGAWLAVDRQISGGSIFAASFIISRAMSPLEMLIGNWRAIEQARAAYASVNGVLDQMSVEVGHTQLPEPKGGIAAQGLVVLNPAGDGIVLQGVSFALERGEVLAIIGPSGAGKSTLVRALCGAISPSQGSVRIDGADMADWDQERLARHIGYVAQDSALFSGTIAENIARFDQETTDRHAVDTALVQAAQNVGADALIRALPDGYDYQLGSHGRGLSAGQAQRVALARAVYGDPQYVILDEPNAHLDAEGDQALAATIGRLKARGATVIIVSHKLSILPLVDKLLMLRGGKVSDFGAREEVLAKFVTADPRRMGAPMQGAQA